MFYHDEYIIIELGVRTVFTKRNYSIKLENLFNSLYPKHERSHDIDSAVIKVMDDIMNKDVLVVNVSIEGYLRKCVKRRVRIEEELGKDMIFRETTLINDQLRQAKAYMRERARLVKGAELTTDEKAQAENEEPFLRIVKIYKYKNPGLIYDSVKKHYEDGVPIDDLEELAYFDIINQQTNLPRRVDPYNDTIDKMDPSMQAGPNVDDVHLDGTFNHELFDEYRMELSDSVQFDFLCTIINCNHDNGDIANRMGIVAANESQMTTLRKRKERALKKFHSWVIKKWAIEKKISIPNNHLDVLVKLLSGKHSLKEYFGNGSPEFRVFEGHVKGILIWLKGRDFPIEVLFKS